MFVVAKGKNVFGEFGQPKISTQYRTNISFIMIAKEIFIVFVENYNLMFDSLILSSSFIIYLTTTYYFVVSPYKYKYADMFTNECVMNG